MRCGSCTVDKPSELFSKDKSRKSGYDCYCKACRKEKCASLYQANKEQYIQRATQWQKDNPELHGIYIKRWFEKNRESVSAYRNQWVRDHPESRRATENRRRAAEGDFAPHEWVELCNKYDNRCLACNKKSQLTVDHVIPLSKGGSNYINNIQPLCKPCNSSKGVKTVDYR